MITQEISVCKLYSIMRRYKNRRRHSRKKSVPDASRKGVTMLLPKICCRAVFSFPPDQDAIARILEAIYA